MDGRIPVFLVGDQTANYLPLAIGLMKASLQKFLGEDLVRHFHFMGLLFQSVEDTVKVGGAFGPGVWLFSNYLWNQRRNLQISAALKSIDPRNLTIHGGPSLPKYEGAYREFQGTHPAVDIGIRGEGELTLVELFAALLNHRKWHRLEPERLSKVTGLTFFTPDSGLQRCPDRPRLAELDQLPSPYLTGVFEKSQGLAWVVETNRGCPYRCTFCDWGSLTAQKIKLFDLERVKQELEWGARRGLKTLFISDANFGIFERDLEIAHHVADLHRRYGYPWELNVAFAKNSKDRVAEIVRVIHRAGIYLDATLSLQAADPTTLEAVGRSNIPAHRFDHLMKAFQQEGLKPSTDLMVRLPGQTYDSFKSDLQIFLDRDIAALIHPTLMLPNSPMASPRYRQEWRIETDDEGRVVACRSFSREEGKRMLALRNAYFFSEFYSFFRYLMRYLQWDHDIPCSEFLSVLVEEFPWFSVALKAESQPYDFTSHHAFKGVITTIHERKFPLYAKTREWVCQRFGLQPDSALETAFLANELVIPEKGGSYPKRVTLEHDFLSYFADHQTGHTGKPLHSYPPTELLVEERAPGQADRLPYRTSARDWVWELETSLRQATAVLA